jgi:hypothetical protein
MSVKQALQENEEFREYVERFSLEVLMNDMINAVLFERTDQPVVFMIRFLSNLVPEQLLNSHGIHVRSDGTFYNGVSSQGVNERKVEDFDEENDFPELFFRRGHSLEEVNLDRSPEVLRKIESVGSKSASSESISD